MDFVQDESESQGPDAMGRGRKGKGDFSQYQKFFLEFHEELERYGSPSPISPKYTGTKPLMKKRSSSVGSGINNMENEGKNRSRTNSAEGKGKTNLRKISSAKGTKRTKPGSEQKNSRVVEEKKSTPIPRVDEETYAKQARVTKNVMSFVKTAYPDWTAAFPDLPLQPLKDFPRAVE